MQPSLLEVKKNSASELLFRWSDGHEQTYSAAYLRKNCRCAYCVNELTGERLLNVGNIPDDLGVEKVALVGRYALNFQFSDSHQTGIYPFKLLYEICPCQMHTGE